jgi:hypothetical protein|tara:strand:- start:275 stop:376 length:102 start_codon:yes stop_codon:yes gene_type:complete
MRSAAIGAKASIAEDIVASRVAVVPDDLSRKTL